MARPTHLEAHTSEYWEELYWKVASRYGALQQEIANARQLTLKNAQQAARIQELELLLSCLRRYGDGVWVEHEVLQRTLHLLPDAKQFIKKGLATSKYLRKDNE